MMGGIMSGRVDSICPTLIQKGHLTIGALSFGHAEQV
jgi:hypothetical protein